MPDAPPLHASWTRGTHLVRSLSFPDWKGALAFVNAVGDVAEELGHHPDVELSWGKVTLKLRTHDEGRVGPLDFALAARIDALSG